MKKTTCTLLLLLFVTVTSFSQNLDSSLKLKGKLDIIPTKYSLSEKSATLVGVPIIKDDNFPEYKSTGNREKDNTEYHSRIARWKEENPSQTNPVKFSVNEHFELAKRIKEDTRFPLNFPKFIYHGDIQKDLLDYNKRIDEWKTENPAEAFELMEKNILKK